MKTLLQLLVTTIVGFALGCALLRDDDELMLVAGAMTASAFFTLYLILFAAHSIFKRRPQSASYADYCEESLLGFDSRGELKIESKYPV
ncbi:hypothetical protein [Pseudoduganella sp. R-34]|uniref:hypothetical protein n=1 Tax=unclassified Pseudoduganella TaxID=2637179 RepID=UPI003CEC4C06